jgi:hypothetical protein
MERLSKREIKADQAFEKLLKEHVAKKNRRTLCISIRGGQLVLSGDDESVTFAHENMEHMTVEELIGAMKNMEKDELNYKTTEKIRFPPMFVKFKGRRWTLQRARDQLQIYLNILGFGKGGSRKYKNLDDEPEGWPDEHSFVDFLHPSYAKLDTVNDIIASLLEFHGYDANNHHCDDDLGDEEPPVPKKRRKQNPKQNRNNIEVEENDNDGEVQEDHEQVDVDAHEQVYVDDLEPVDTEDLEPVNGDLEEPNEEQHLEMCAYEEMREQNIKERKKKMKELGLLPHSKVRNEWR